ncbi:MAG: hypothetical protein ACON47_04450 [Flavobacteriaceae bacterium]
MKNVWLSFLLCLSIQCHQEPTLATIEEAVLLAHGGDLHKNIKSISYQKKIWKLSPTSDTISQVIENHSVSFENGFATLSWNHEGNLWEAKKEGHFTELKKNGSQQKDSLLLEKTAKRLQAAQFVFWQPFKFVADAGQKSYKGKRTLFNGWKVDEIEVVYPNSDDRWFFFFDQESNRLKATGVFHNNRYSLITNDNQEAKSGLWLHKKRTSYFTDSLFQPQRKSTLYEYTLQNINY